VIDYLGFVWNSNDMTISLPSRKRESILKLVIKALELNCDTIQNASILIGNLISATPAVDYAMIIQGGCHSLENLKVAEVIWSWCETNNCWLSATYLNTKANFIADKASRQILDENDFSLDNLSFTKIAEHFGQPSVDLFATSHTKKCTKFYSWYPDPECAGVDAFSHKWEEHFYAFPPFSLIPRVLRKIQDDKSRGIIIVPDWKTQPWFPVFMKMKYSKTLKFKKGTFQLSSPFSNRNHPMSESLSLLVAVVSGSS
jgi:hypothetical protein